jgi:hypothetical protein
MEQVNVNEHWRYKTPPLVIGFDQKIEFGAVSDEDRAGENREDAETHSTRLPHQEENKQICDEQDDRELVWPIHDRSGKPQRFAIRHLAVLLSTVWGSNGGSANCASVLTGSDYGTAAATHCGPWWIRRVELAV